ncbi:hypothetical protein D9619_009950 [Psilocybe cf. subviscida]|uniref:Carboxylic ester hydrolase n=1 Tax=Psilocybe cf. subviscida TaxID=2480587 RepID=A0A8H5BL70_9AGAR|nr:hypothetical protein D9619_009950 [Psilocybe cf. subviscida]
MTGLSEDCLSVDIYRPAGISPDAKLPVVVWAFGGGFLVGAASQYDGSNLVARSVARGTPIIYVSHNYRLGLLGLPQGQEADDRKILNLALKDHLTALEWVQANIASFGGDKSKVTVFGQSSGAQIISALMFNSPLHKLSRAAILQSGSSNSLTSLRASQWESSWQAFVSGVPSCNAIATSGKTLDCLSKANTTELFAAVNLTLEKALTFGLTIDGPDGLLPDLPSTLLSEGHFAKMPFITGTNLDEGTVPDKQSRLPA